MFDRLSNNEFTEAIEEMFSLFGVSEDVPCENLAILLRKNGAQECIEEIASRLGLPVRIELSYIPKDFTPNNPNRFDSNSLVQTDWRGRGIEGIAAQVSIPEFLPMLGTAALKGYPIKVRVGENCHKHGYAFIAIILHELSHVLLASVRSPHKDSELHTDLVPIILGFRKAVRRGRIVVETTATFFSEKTTTTKYGYLTDAQFDLACNYVTETLTRHEKEKRSLFKKVLRLQRRTRKVVRILADFRDYFSYLDSHPPRKMKAEHAMRVIQLHSRDNTLELEGQTTVIGTHLNTVLSFLKQIDHHYLPSTVKHLGNHAEALKQAEKELHLLTQAIVKDRKVLGKYVPLTYKSKRALFYRPSPR